jgi:hypothetical protein
MFTRIKYFFHQSNYLVKEKVPEQNNKLIYYYITCFGVSNIKYFGRIISALLAVGVYIMLSWINVFNLSGWDISYRFLQVVIVFSNIGLLLALIITRKLPEYRGEPAISDFTAILTVLYSPFNYYSYPWILFALLLYFALNELKIVKKIKNNLKNEEKFLFFSYFINIIISVKAAIIIHIIYGGYRALPLVGIFFGN